VIETLGSLLGPHPESDLVTDLYFGSTSIANMEESDRWIIINTFKESVILPLAMIGALDSPLRSHLKSDLAADLYSVSTPIAIIDESGHHISFNSLNKSIILLSVVIEHCALL
jgi:hypothetical protein